MILQVLAVALTLTVDAPSIEAISAAPPSERAALIETRLEADRAALQSAMDSDRPAAALSLSRSLLTLGWSRSLAPERVLLGMAMEAERAQTAGLAGELLDAVDALTGPGSGHRALLPYRAVAITLLAAAGEIAAADAHAAWQGVPLRRAHPRLIRLAAWSADAAGDLRSGSDRHSMLVKQGDVHERWLAQLNKRVMHQAGQWPTPEAPWQVLLLAEARAHGASDASASEALLADALPMLVAGGWSDDEAAEMLADRMAAIPAGEGLPFARTALARATHAAAMVTRGEVDAWTDAPIEGAAAPWARVACRRAARALEARGDDAQAMSAWAGAGAAGDNAAARRAAAWVLGLEDESDDGGVIDRVRALPQRNASLVAEGVRARREGRIEDAIRAWVRVPPGTSLQAAALAAAAAQLRRADLDALGTQVQRLRAAAAAAMTDAGDLDRVALARLASGWSLSALIHHALDTDRVDAAAALLERDPARGHLSRGDALRAAARLALRRGEPDEAVAALAAHDLPSVRRLLVERALMVIGPARGVLPDPTVADARGLRAVAPLLVEYLDTDEVQHRMLIADALRLDGRGDPERYRALLEAHRDLADAMFGLAELLAQAPDEADRAEAMELYRSLVAGPVDAAPDRWWRAQLRMLELARWAGRPDAELEARVERLRHLSPDLGGVTWAGPIRAAIQSSN